MITKSKRAPSTPKAIPITEGIPRPRLICEGSSVEDGVVGMTAGLRLGGDCVGADSVSACAILSCGVGGTMCVVVIVTGLSGIVSVSNTSLPFEIVRDAVEVAIIKLWESVDSISTCVVLS